MLFPCGQSESKVCFEEADKRFDLKHEESDSIAYSSSEEVAT